MSCLYEIASNKIELVFQRSNFYTKKDDNLRHNHCLELMHRKDQQKIMHELQPRDSPIFEREEKDWEISLGSMVGSFVLWPSLSSPWSGSRITKDHGNQRDDRRKNAGVHNFFQIKEMLKEDIEKQLWHFLAKKL